MKEQDIVNSIIEVLDRSDKVAFVMRMNSGMIKTENRLVRLAPAGTSDIIGMMSNGKFLAIEVKTPKRYKSGMTDLQRQFLEKIDENGGEAIYTCDTDTVINFLKNYENN